MNFITESNISANISNNVIINTDNNNLTVNTPNTTNNTYYLKNNILSTLNIKKPEKSERRVFYIKKIHNPPKHHEL